MIRPERAPTPRHCRPSLDEYDKQRTWEEKVRLGWNWRRVWGRLAKEE